MTQGELAAKLGTDQNAISRMESVRYGRQTLTTLKRVAAIFDVALVVRFVPFSQLVDWVSGAPYVDRGLRTAALEVPDFNSELSRGAFAESTRLTEANVLAQAPQQGVSRNSWTEALVAVYTYAKRQEDMAKEFLASEIQRGELVREALRSLSGTGSPWLATVPGKPLAPIIPFDSLNQKPVAQENPAA